MTRPLRSTDPTRIGDYELTGRIGGGGMGDVFLGRSPGGRVAAVKVVRDLLADDPRFRERFRREVAAARLVSGAYTAAVLDADPDAERPWLATAYIDGPTLLRRVFEDGPLDARAARALGAGLAEALRDIHRAGLVHRDLKPGNVLLAADGPRLIDFGIIRGTDGEVLTETGYVLGSAGYMAPEQVAGGEATAAADVYSLGAVLTFAATGHGPFGDGPMPGVLLRQASGDRDISAVPEGLRDVVSRCLDILPGGRPTTDSLLELLGGNAISDGATFLDAPDPEPGPEPENAEIAATPTTLMRTGPKKSGTKNPATKKPGAKKPGAKQSGTKNSATKTSGTKNSGTKNSATPRSSHRPKSSPPQPIPTRRKFLFLGIAGAAVAAFSVGVAAMPHGDSKSTDPESTDSDVNDATSTTGLSTKKAQGVLGGPMKSPLWSSPDTYADYLALSGTTLLVQGTTLSAFDTATGKKSWTVPKGTFNQVMDGTLPAFGDSVYETTDAGDLVAAAVADGREAWSVPGPDSWLTRGLVGASSDIVVGWSYTDVAQAGSGGIWGVDPQSHQLRWSTKIGGFEGAPYFCSEAGLIVLSQPNSHQVTAYSTQTGSQAWVAKDSTPSADAAFATAVASHGKTVYWATNRLYAFDENGHAIWPVAVIAEGGDSAFHAVIADDTTVYAASEDAGLSSANTIAAYKASDGAPLWRTLWPKDFRDPSLECQLALGGGNLYIVDHMSGTLVCLDAKTGETNWQFHDAAASSGSVDDWHLVANDQYVFVGYQSTVHCFTAN